MTDQITDQQLDEYEALARNATLLGADIASPGVLVRLAAEVRRLRAVEQPPVDRAALRDRIASAVDGVFDAWRQGLGPIRPQDALADAVLAVLSEVAAVSLLPADQTALPVAEAKDRLRGMALTLATGEGPLVEPWAFNQALDDYQAAVAAAVLPEPADRAADWRAAADLVEAMNEGYSRTGCTSCAAREDAADGLRDTARRMADDTQQGDPTSHQPRRGDEFERWLKSQRDEHRDTGNGVWTTLDNLLDQYRLHADTGTPLGEHVCEGRVAGDCECLEQPAAGAQQDGAQQ
ncbi:hypothetical protein [Streptomyces sp. SID10815]|uniref:hypothetical protein n=1 Tax=Streptomyces sp. SID10815 TaxID=2706027 RepID=UPI0013CBD8CF|nr:hypothetical protein [Streptomyces sp. SID10815]NEA52371.1 hypothetical protein [Streptomyces sp. SID10815]